MAPGGQAGSSSKIENYLGFPTGVSGNDLAARAYTQAQKFGAEIMIARGAASLSCDAKAVLPSSSTAAARLHTHAIVIATGAAVSPAPTPNLERFDGAGIYYGATFIEAQICGAEEVVVVGGGNSAGQAAVFLARRAATCMSWCAAPVSPRACRATLFDESKRARHHAAPAHRDRRARG